MEFIDMLIMLPMLMVSELMLELMNQVNYKHEISFEVLTLASPTNRYCSKRSSSCKNGQSSSEYFIQKLKYQHELTFTNLKFSRSQILNIITVIMVTMTMVITIPSIMNLTTDIMDIILTIMQLLISFQLHRCLKNYYAKQNLSWTYSTDDNKYTLSLSLSLFLYFSPRHFSYSLT